jgi:hypothetical protein
MNVEIKSASAVIEWLMASGYGYSVIVTGSMSMLLKVKINLLQTEKTRMMAISRIDKIKMIFFAQGMQKFKLTKELTSWLTLAV